MPVFVVLLIAMAAEIAVMITVGQAIGALTTILLLFVVSMLGATLLRRQGTRTITAVTDALRNRRDPQPEMVDGMLLGVAAALVLFPGFISDAAALLLLFPPTRAVVRERVLRRAQTRRSNHVTVVDGDVVEPDPVIIDAPAIDPRRD
jgi:UPF0716 protein FxsA